MGLKVLCQMASIVEALLANGAGVSSWYFVLLVSVFSGVMLLEVIFSVKALVTQSTSKAGRLAMLRLLMSLAFSSRKTFCGTRHTQSSLWVSRVAAVAAAKSELLSRADGPMKER